MKEQLITFETAKLAKEKGYPTTSTYGFRHNGEWVINQSKKQLKLISQPTQSLLKKWLREIHNIHCTSDCNTSGWFWVIEKTNGTFISDSDFIGENEDSGMWDTYEKALEEGLQEGLKLII